MLSAVSFCTTALHLALLASGVQHGDEVLCPSLSFIATANAIVHTGATPVFVDIDESTYNIDPASIEDVIAQRTKAILAVQRDWVAWPDCRDREHRCPVWPQAH
jgi:dTDP-4-amino-4,6-dideoxygalactose transaminase